MIIKNVSVCGFNRLYEGYKKAENENRKAYGAELGDYLKHCMISIVLNDLTTIEIFYLKKFCSELVITNKEYKNFINSQKEPDIYQKIDGIINLHNEMISDEDIDKSKICIDNILPIGCESYSAIAIFRGSSITAITGGFIDDIFKNEGSTKLVDKYIGNSRMEEKISGIFYREFYQFIYRKSSDFDIVTSYMMDTKFYQYSEDICDIAYINTLFGEIIFFANNEKGLKFQREHIRDSQSSNPYYLPEKTYITFVMNTSFSTFLKLYLDTNYITNHQNLNYILSKDEINVSYDVINKYKARISNFVDYILSYKKGIIKNKEINLNRLNYIFNGTKILYTIQLSISEISEFCKILKNIDELVVLEDKLMNYKKIVENIVG